MIGFAVPFWLNRSHLHMTSPGRYSLSAADETVGQFTLGLVSIVVVGAAAIGITVGLRRHYRCPKCNAIPMGSWNSLGPDTLGLNRGVALNPPVCRSCGAPLSVRHRGARKEVLASAPSSPLIFFTHIAATCITKYSLTISHWAFSDMSQCG